MPSRFRSTSTDPGKRGHELGRRFCGEVQATIAAYERLFEALSGSPVDLRDWGEAALSGIGGVAPALVEEVEGIASGASVDVRAVAALNARTEILATLGVTRAEECSAVVVVRPDRAPLVAQAWDWYVGLADLWFVWEIPHADGSATTTLTEFGILGKIGVNSRGVGVLFNILHHEADGNGLGAPVHTLSRAVLDTANDLDDARAVLDGASLSASTSLTMASPSAALSVELNPAGMGVVEPDGQGLLVHTNHFLSWPAREHDTNINTSTDTVVRLETLQQRLTAAPPQSVQDVISAMTHHLPDGGGVCCHPDPDLPRELQLQTLATVVLDVSVGSLLARAGGPCAVDQARRSGNRAED